MNNTRLAFGPVPSRRLGRSLGINNIPPKHCTYSCVYCQVGVTVETEMAPRHFFPPEVIRHAVEERLATLRRRGERVDYLTFVPDGEPTLDAQLDAAIDSLRPLGVPVAVISNGSLLWREDVRKRLARADWVSLKVDTVDDVSWRRINRAHPALKLTEILDGMLCFAEVFHGTLVTETMLLAGLNDSAAAMGHVADFLARMKPAKAYLAVPTRPPAEPDVRPPPEDAIVRAYTVFQRHLAHVECLTGFEGTDFPCSGDAEQDLLAITAVHPLREDAARQFLKNVGLTEDLLQRLVDQGHLGRVEFSGKRFYVRRHAPGDGRHEP